MTCHQFDNNRKEEKNVCLESIYYFIFFVADPLNCNDLNISHLFVDEGRKDMSCKEITFVWG